MKKLSIFLILILIIESTLLIFPNKNIAIESNDLVPIASSNVQRYSIRYSSLVPLSTGYMRVFYDSTNKNVGVEYYDNNFKITKKSKINMELSIYGGFYASSNAYYLVEGQNNTEEDDNAEVIRVIKYNTNWVKQEEAKIIGDGNAFGKQIRYPFDAGCVEMAEVNGKLYIVTGHEGYVDPDFNQGHQGFLMIEVDESAMTGKIVDADLWHSFAQYIDYKDQYMYVLEQSEGSRYTQLSRYDKNSLAKSSIPVLNYGGSRDSAWALPCYASVDGMAISNNNILTIGTSIDQANYDKVKTTDMPHNIYLTVTPINDFKSASTNLVWLTDYTDDEKSFTGLEIIKINDNRFMVCWEEYGESQDMIDNDTLSTGKIHYIFIDENGKKLGSEYTANATMSDCRPVLKNNKIVFYTSNANMVDFYSIDSSNGKFNKTMYRVAGENATWSLDGNGTLKISGKGEITVDPEAIVKGPLSSTGGFSYSSGDNCWEPIRDSVKKIVVEEGITNIPENEFRYFSNLYQVILPKSMKTIGASAFYSCRNLEIILILSNVNNIGEDILWTGSTWVGSGGKVYYATIYTTQSSYAESYAKERGITCKYVEELTLTDSRTGTILKVIGEPTTQLSVSTLSADNQDYNDMKSKISDKYIMPSYSISTNSGLCFGEKELTFTFRKAYIGKNISLVQKKSNGEIVVINKIVDSNGNISIATDELSSFMIGIDPNDVDLEFGDVDGDGFVTISDCLAILRHVKEVETLTGEKLERAKIDKDNMVTISDYTALLRHVKEIELLNQ